MSMEQNEPQLDQGQQGPPSVPVSTTEGGPGGNPNGQQQRRRRRRRKTGRGAASPGAAGSPDGQPQPQSTAAAPTLPVRDQALDRQNDRPADRTQARDQDRDQFRGEQSREPGQTSPREASAAEQNRDQRPRQGRNQQQHGKKQQRQAKGSGGGSGSSQGRQFQKGSSQPQPVREHNPGNGTGHGPAGARRKQQKGHRVAPSFVGPMDHSYRVANGNIADGSPSTMDYRSNTVNGNGNGNVHGRNGYSDSEFAAPIILREDAPVRIVCFIEDLLIVARMQETARKLGVKVSFVKAEKETLAKLMDAPEAERPSLIVFDLNNANAKPLTLIPKLKAKLKRSTSIIGFLSHIQGDLKMKATEAGCDTVMPKAAFSQNLPNLLRRHGLDEELEPLEV